VLARGGPRSARRRRWRRSRACAALRGQAGVPRPFQVRLRWWPARSKKQVESVFLNDGDAARGFSRRRRRPKSVGRTRDRVLQVRGARRRLLQ
jgi:hypothetical protein